MKTMTEVMASIQEHQQLAIRCWRNAQELRRRADRLCEAADLFDSEDTLGAAAVLVGMAEDICSGMSSRPCSVDGCDGAHWTRHDVCGVAGCTGRLARYTADDGVIVHCCNIDSAHPEHRRPT